MSLIKLQGNASGTGAFTIAAPNGNTDRTLTLPDATGTVVTANGSGDIATTSITPSAGIYLGGSGSANLLDDYEEGTYTLSITLSSGSVTKKPIDTANYIKIGALVFVSGRIDVQSVSTPSGNALINLPFVIATLPEEAARGSVQLAFYKSNGGNLGDFDGRVESGSAFMSVYNTQSNQGTQSGAYFQADSEIWFSAVYRTDA